MTPLAFTGMDASTGRAITGDAHESQSVACILNTPIGSRVMRRDFGSLLPDLIDQPLNKVLILKIYAATALALLRWEPRRRLKKVSIDIAEWGLGRAVVTLDLERHQTSAQRQVEQISINLAARASRPAGLAASANL
jgi:phage baseplate assembly protein W